jgi:hypothetical protein
VMWPAINRELDLCIAESQRERELPPPKGRRRWQGQLAEADHQAFGRMLPVLITGHKSKNAYLTGSCAPMCPGRI